MESQTRDGWGCRLPMRPSSTQRATLDESLSTIPRARCGETSLQQNYGRPWGMQSIAKRSLRVRISGRRGWLIARRGIGALNKSLSEEERAREIGQPAQQHWLTTAGRRS